MSRFGDDAPATEKPKTGWGGDLPKRGAFVARMLDLVSNPVLPLPQRMGDCQRLASCVLLSDHLAWRLAIETRILLGWPGTGKACGWALIRKQPPGGRWASAEEWLRAAGLTDEGRWPGHVAIEGPDEECD